MRLSNSTVKSLYKERKFLLLNTFFFFFSSIFLFSTSGHSTVMPDGSFSYSVPIELPAGVKGVKPNLSINYNSNGRNGILGKGWTLSGLPSLTRINNGKGIQYNGQDTFAGLSGKLISVGTDTWRSENEDWSEYKGSGSCGDSYCTWTVVDKSGNTLTFGGEENSRIEAVGKNGSIRTWALNRFEDTQGNYYIVDYSEDTTNGDYYPKSITYTIGNEILSYYNVIFNTKTRSDIQISYDQNAKVETDQLLDSVVIQYNGTELNKYTFEYDTSPSSQKSRITKINKIKGGVTQTTAFDWSTGSTGHIATQRIISTVGNGEHKNVTQGDWNGDGLIDLGIYDPSGYFSTFLSDKDSKLSGEHKTKVNNEAYKILSGDWNGDGFTDLGFYYQGGNPGALDVYLSKGDGTFETTGIVSPVNNGATYSNILANDWNGDGITDLALYYSNGAISVHINDGTGKVGSSVTSQTNNEAYQLLPGDWNGDGVMDLGMYYQGGSQGALDVYLNNGDGSFKSGVVTFVNNNAISGKIVANDWNSDGITDLLLYYPTGQINLYLGIGNGSVVIHSTMQTNNEASNLLPIDWNGDGNTDLGLYFKTGALDVYLNSGNGKLQPGGKVTFVNNNAVSPMTGDWNGDGLADLTLYYPSGGTSGEINIYSSQNGNPDQLTKVVEPLGRKVYVEYQSARNSESAIDPKPKSAIADGSLESSTIQSPVNNEALYEHIHTNDWNGDGITDLALYYPGGSSAGALDVYLNNGDGSMGAGGIVSWVNNNANKVLPGDWNGDGITDLGLYYSGGVLDVYLNNGSGALQTMNIRSSVNNDATFNHIFTNDWNGDGITDLALYYPGGSSAGALDVYLNNGDGSMRAGGIVSWVNNNAYRVLPGDWNGDGITDLGLYYQGGVLDVYLNDGSGTLQSTNIRSTVNNLATFNNIMAEDWNNDGIMDLALYYSNGVVDIYINNGDGSMAPNNRNYVKASTERLLPKDWNGDGLIDLGIYSSNGTLDVHLNKGTGELQAATSYSEVGNSAYKTLPADWDNDGIIDLGLYYSSGNLNIYLTKGDPPYSDNIIADDKGIHNTSAQSLVKTVKISDGRAESGWTDTAGNDVDQLSRYEYVNGRYFPGKINEAKTLGFQQFIESVEVVDKNGTSQVLSTIVTEFRQDALIDLGNGLVHSPFGGSPIKKTRYAGSIAENKKVSAEEYRYNDNGTHLYPAGTESDIRQTLLTQKVTTKYHYGVETHQVQEDFTYDSFGRTTQQKKCLKNGTSLSDCKIIDSEYVSWDVGSNWKADNLTKATESMDGKILTVQKLAYVDPAKPTQVNRIDKLLCQDVNNCSEANGRWIPVKYDIQYFPNGLIKSERATTTHWAEYLYDNRGLKVQSKIHANSRQYTQSQTFDEQGRVLSQTDQNGLVTTFEYTDSEGKVIKTNPSGGKEEILSPVQGRLYKETKITDIIDSVIKVGSNESTKTITEHTDGLGFQYLSQEKEEYLPGTEYEKTSTITVNKEQEYDGKQRITKVTLPYWEGKTPQWITTRFNEFGKKIRIDHPDGSWAHFQYEYDPANKTKTKITTTGKGSSTGDASKEIWNQQGQLIETIDALGNSTLYQYDIAGNIVETTLPVDGSNPNRQKLTTTFDNFGQKLTLNDPSTGLVSYTYDDRGNMTFQTDSLSRVTQFQYDDLSRILSKIVNYGTTEQKTITYEYDGTNGFAETWPVGKVSKIIDESGTRIYAYDKTGQVSIKSTQLNNLEGSQVEQMKNSRFGQPLEYTFPDGSVQSFAYSFLNRIERIYLKKSGETNAAEYAHFSEFNGNGRVLKKELRNNINTTYQYDEVGQLSSLQSCFANSSGMCTGDPLQNLTYQFGKSGQLNQIIDHRTNTQKTDLAGRSINTNASQEFIYDAIGRLKTAYWGSQTSSTGVIQYSYNSFGNITRRTVNDTLAGDNSFVSYVYDGQKMLAGYTDEQHSDANKKFSATYNTVGNMTQKFLIYKDATGDQIESTQTYGYDAENRLISVQREVTGPSGITTSETEYTYDHKGQRTSKIYRTNGETYTTWYIGNTYEIRQNTKTGIQTHTKILIAGKHGKIASITEEKTEQQVAALLAGQSDMLANSMGFGSMEGLSNKFDFFTFARVMSPSTPIYLQKGLLLLAIGGLVVLLLIQIRQDKNKKGFRSDFSKWQRAIAMPVLVAFMASSCGTPTGSESGTAGAGLTSIDGPSLAYVNETTEGVPTGEYYYHPDHIGSSSVVTDENGNEVTRINYNPFGTVSHERSDGTNTVTHKFTAQELDEETALMYYNARYYDPEIGRFITADTMVPDYTNAQTYNRYAYVYNNPINYSDPSGHWGWNDFVKGLNDAKDDFVSDINWKKDSFLKGAEELAKNPAQAFRNNRNLRKVGMIAASVSGPIAVGIYAAALASNDGASPGEAIRIGLISGATSYLSAEYGSPEFFDGAAEIAQQTATNGAIYGTAAALNGGSFSEGFTGGVISAGVNVGISFAETHADAALMANSRIGTFTTDTLKRRFVKAIGFGGESSGKWMPQLITDLLNIKGNSGWIPENQEEFMKNQRSLNTFMQDTPYMNSFNKKILVTSELEI